MPQLSISPKFFRNERRNYRSWIFALWREFYQNSIDAGAKNIDITIESGVDKNPEITFKDDGCGFDEKTRDDVYFCLGETSKGGNFVGGFGKARIVTCFSHEWYSISSQNWIAKGSGSSYDISPCDWVNGCEVKVKLDTGDSSTCDVSQALYRFLRLCHNSNCNVRINGVLFKDWCHKRSFVKDLSFGKVYTNKSGNYTGTLIVRVSGVAMFTRCIQPNIQVVIEIDPFNSREILLSNRDEFQIAYSNELNSFIQSLASNTKEVLRRDRRIMELYGNKPKVTKRRQKKEDVGSFRCVVIPVKTVTPNDFVTPNEIPKVVSEAALRMRDNRLMEDINDLIPSAVLICDSYRQSVRNVAQRYNPERWAYFGGGGNREKLLRQWTIMCESSIQDLLDITGSESISWRPGFCLSDGTVAFHTQDSNDVHSLMINPVDDDGKMLYRLRSHDDWTSMMVSAAHEVAHIVCDGHNEDFAILFGQLTKKTFKNRKVVFSSLLSSLKNFAKISY